MTAEMSSIHKKYNNKYFSDTKILIFILVMVRI